MFTHPGKLIAGILMLTVGFLGAGCKSLPHCPPAKPALVTTNLNDLMRQHVLELSAEGYLYDLRPNGGHRAMKAGPNMTDYLRTNVMAAFDRSGKSSILIFVHGGLTSRDSGLHHFTNSFQEILAGGSYPVFVVWPSGGRGTYAEHLVWVRRGMKPESTEEKAFSIGTIPFVLLADAGRAVTRLPMVLANSMRSDLETVRAAKSWDGGTPVQRYCEMVASNYPVVIGDDYSRTSDRTLRGATYWGTLPFKFLTASCLDGLGKGAWDVMLRRTHEVYPARADSNTLAQITRSIPTNATRLQAWQLRKLQIKQAERATKFAAAGLPAFLEELQARQAANPNLQVTLVGHSMGAIILNRVLRDTPLKCRDIVYMGAACSIDDFAVSALPYLRNHPETHFYNLCLHPVAEAGEWQIRAADLTPRGSLLVWIDNFFANPVHDRERTFGRWRNLFRCKDSGQPIVQRLYDNDPTGTLKERLHFRAFSVGFGDAAQQRANDHQWNAKAGDHPTGPDARCNHPLSHGEFSEMPYWKPEFWWPANAARP